MSFVEADKITVNRDIENWNSNSYVDHYVKDLRYLRDSEITLLELGVGGGADEHAGGKSLKAWKEYFSKAQIVGLDYFNKKSLEEDRIRIYQGSQADPVAISNLIYDFPGGFDVIVDDGSHRSEHVLASLLMLWQYVKSDGWYIIKDAQSSCARSRDAVSYGRTTPVTSMSFLKSLVDGLNWQDMQHSGYRPSAFDLEVEGIHFYQSMVFLKKFDKTKGNTDFAGSRIDSV